MNYLDLFVKLYRKTFLSQLPFFFSPIRRVLRWMANIILPKFLEKKYENETSIVKGLIVSLTSFPARINSVWQVVECMRHQTICPEKIILWLSKNQFPTMNTIPLSLRERESEIFEIRLVDGDLRSHKKYYYAIKEFPNSLLFLVDDDIYYPTDILECSYKEYVNNTNCVVCNYGYELKWDKNGNLKPYHSFKRITRKTISKAIFFGTGGGTLIDASKLPKETQNIENAMNLTPKADDIWMNAMVRLANMNISILSNGSLLPIIIKNNSRLATDNMQNNENDLQFSNIINYYIQNWGVNPFAPI